MQTDRSKPRRCEQADMFGTSGIRGPVGSTITASLAMAVGHALGVDAERVVVGRDPRDSGRAYVEAISAALRESGTDVVDLGMAGTPTIARSVAWEDADAGVAITASHNPAEDNGIKLWQPSGQAFDEGRREQIVERIESGTTSMASWDAFGERVHRDRTGRHVETIIDTVDIDEELQVVVDVGNGAGGVTVEALDELGCHVETLNAQPDGSFPGRPSEPTPEHCATLATVVGETNADVGIAHDGDADRMRAVDETGQFLSGDVLLAIFARASTQAGESVAVPVDTSLAVEDYLTEVGIETVRTPVGDVYVAAATSQANVSFGGEPSGAWIWPEQTLCPDGPLAACRLAALVADRSLATRAREIPTYPLRRESFEVADKNAAMASIERRVRDGIGEEATISTLDGIRVDYENSWYLIRPSGTQPLIRITAEARTERELDAIYADAADLVRTCS